MYINNDYSSVITINLDRNMKFVKQFLHTLTHTHTHIRCSNSNMQHGEVILADGPKHFSSLDDHLA